MKVYTRVIASLESIESSEAHTEKVCLNFDDRKRGRLKITTENGLDAGIQIERGQVLRDGSWIESESGDLLKVCALPEEVSTAYIDDALLFARACYHLGNRHVPLQIGEGFLRYQRDYVLDDMLHGLGIHAEHELSIFEPENGAYAKGEGAHGHSHHGDSHHSHGAEHAHHH